METNGKPPRILVVDDDKLMRELLKAILRDEGFNVVGEAKDGRGALTQVGKLAPDLVCLDVNMPGMSGLEVLKAIQQATPVTKVVMVTGDASMATVREAVGFGADAVWAAEAAHCLPSPVPARFSPGVPSPQRWRVAGL